MLYIHCLLSSITISSLKELWEPYASHSESCVTGYQETSDSPEWDEVLAAMAAEITVRHYSRKTLITYAKWSRHFQRFLKNKSPQELSTGDVKVYLTFLAVSCKVAASAQNQASNSLLFSSGTALSINNCQNLEGS